ncbi:MAG: NfeD family protein [Halanaerobiales bacterium]|nr:NfeD family protein [Halanaerobiales bacterium]
MRWIWLILAIFLGIGELLTVEFLLLWFCLGALAAAVVANFYSFVYQLLIFVLISAVFIIFSRKVIWRRKEIKTNISALLEKEGVVVETVGPIYCKPGLIKFNGEFWRAYSEEEVIHPGVAVIIVKVDGVKLKVRALEKF